MTGDNARFVLDTSALLALRSDEAGAARVEAVLRAAEAGEAEVLASFMTRMEISYRVEADEGGPEATAALRLLDAMPIRWISCDADILARAAGLKARGGLSVADAWIAATALLNDAILLHRDPEFTPIVELAQELLT